MTLFSQLVPNSSFVTADSIQTLTNKTLNSPTLTGTTSFTGTYHNSYLTQYGSMFIEGTSTNNIVQVSSTGVGTGGGLWSTGVGNTLFSNAGLYFKINTTLRDRDTPTGGTIALSIENNTNAIFAGTVTANSVLLTGNTGTVTSVSGTGTVNGLTLTGTVTNSGSLTLGGTLSNVSLTSQVTDTLPVTSGGTGVTTSTGTGSVVLSTSPSLTTPSLGVASATSLNVAEDITQTWAASMDRFIGSKFSTSYEVGLHLLEATRETRVTSKAADGTGLISLYTGVTPTERMRIDSSGKVGIGTNAPASQLSVISAVGTDAARFSDNANYTFAIRSGGAVGVGLFTGTVSSALAFGANDTEKMRLTTGGDLGIGTTTASARLTVIPSSNPTSATGTLQIAIGEDSNNSIYQLRMGYIYDGSYKSVINSIAGGNGAVLSLNPSGGSVGIGTSSPTTSRVQIKGINNTTNAFDDGLKVTSANETVSTQYSWAGINANDTLLFATGGTERMRIASSGIVTATTSFNAPVFYNTPDTAYYVDPNGTSRLNNLSLNTTAVTSGITGLTSAPITTEFANAGDTSTWYPMTHQRAMYSGGYVTHLNTGLYKHANQWGSGATGWYAAIGGNDSYPTQAWYLTHDAYIQNSLGAVLTSGSFRAPIFYDLDNTGYYTDSASASRMNTISLDQVNVGDGTFLFKTGAGSGTTRHLNLSTYAGDPSQAQTGQSGITWGYRSDNEAYYMIHLTHGDYSAHTKLSLSWHTGIRIGAAPAYGGTAFYANSLNVNSALLFTVGRGDDSVRSLTTFRAPIMYDIDNGAYYVDPGSTTNLSDLTITGAAHKYLVINPGNGYEAMVRYVGGGSGSSWYVGKRTTTQLVDTASFHFYSEAAATTVAGIDTSGNILASGSMRAPIFYDSNDTTYFVNPNSTSSIYNTLTIGPNITYGRYLRLGGDAGDVTEATVAASNGNLHIDAKTGYKLYLSWFNTADTMIGGGVQALIYYDRESTAYYIDAATNSVLNTLSLGGRSTTYAMYYQGFTLDANTMDHNATGFTYAVNAPYVGPIVRLSAGGGYDLQLNAPYSGNGNKLSYRTRQGDAGIFNGWQPVATYNSNYGGELFATLFIDSDSTGYFVNPAGNSAFEALTVRKGAINLGTGNSRQLEISNAGSGACNISFHREGVYGAHFGLDTDNWFSTYGWSAGGGYTNMRVGALQTNVLMRYSHNSGHLRGGYNNIGGSEGYTSPIYTIGTSYEPAATTLSNMYGIGFTAGGSFMPSGASNWGMYVASDGVARIFLSGGNGEITATGNITAYASDRRLKTNITPITNAVDKLMQINGVEFDWVDNIQDIGFIPQQMHETGVIAQEIQAVIPDAVKTAPFNNNATDIAGFDSDYLTVDKEKIIPLLIEAIKEQQASINRLEDKLNLLENK